MRLGGYLAILVALASCHEAPRNNLLDPALTPPVELAVDLDDTAGTAILSWSRYDQSAAPQGCFQGRPFPECRSFWITEFGFSERFSTTHMPQNAWDTNEDSWRMTFEGGYMKNLGKRSALGATIFFRGSDGRLGLGVRPRGRWWLDKDKSLDISPGIFFGDGSFTGQVALSTRNQLGATLEVDMVQEQQWSSRMKHFSDHYIINWYAGAKVDDLVKSGRHLTDLQDVG